MDTYLYPGQPQEITIPEGVWAKYVDTFLVLANEKKIVRWNERRQNIYFVDFDGCRIVTYWAKADMMRELLSKLTDDDQKCFVNSTAYIHTFSEFCTELFDTLCKDYFVQDVLNSIWKANSIIANRESAERRERLRRQITLYYDNEISIEPEFYYPAENTRTMWFTVGGQLYYINNTDEYKFEGDRLPISLGTAKK